MAIFVTAPGINSIAVDTAILTSKSRQIDGVETPVGVHGLDTPPPIPSTSVNWDTAAGLF